MKQTGKKVAMVILALLPLFMVLAVYKKLPEQVPMHWGIDGTVDRYGKKGELFLLAGMNIFLGILMPLLAKIDPKRRNYAKFQETYDWMILWLLGFMAMIMGVTLMETLHPGLINISKVVCGMVAVLFIVIGNMMPKVKRNFFTGVKTPWALSSDVVWNKTQRLGGKFFFFGGFLMLGSVFLFSSRVMFGMTIAVALLICLVPVVMSYIWYQKELKKRKNDKE